MKVPSAVPQPAQPVPLKPQSSIERYFDRQMLQHDRERERVSSFMYSPSAV